MQGPVCPLPLTHTDKIVLGHGSGGRMSHDLIQNIFLSSYSNPVLHAANDAGVVNFDETFVIKGKNQIGQIAISTDAHVISPIFFPGGDIGRLAICGTVNDVAMMGAQPKYITASFILEEGLEIDVLEKITRSMKIAADEAGVQIVAGDTKVVQKGKADQIFISTTGVGIIPEGVVIGGGYAQDGDIVILSGSIGDHGIAVLAARGDLGFAAEVQSDVAPLNHLVKAIIDTGATVHTLRDPTRGGLATSLNEIAEKSQICIEIKESQIPINPVVNSACELLGFDPLYVANEGKMIAIVAQEHSELVLDSMHNNKYGIGATIIGKVSSAPVNRVLLHTRLGSKRVVDMLSGEMLPRIC